MQRCVASHRVKGMTLLDVLLVLIVLLLVAALLFPIFARTDRGSARKACCLGNLKELAVALQLYSNDYDQTLPSSFLRSRNKKWDARSSAEFCSERGIYPPTQFLRPQDTGWVQLLRPHMMNKDSIWCPNDTDRTMGVSERDKRTIVSYIYKPAVDRAWFGAPYPVDVNVPDKNLKIKSFRRVTDFGYPADQMVFFERTNWHWKNQDKGWREDVVLNTAFLDGHVRIVRLSNAAECDTPRTSTELAGCLFRPGEPLWFNYDSRKETRRSYTGEKGLFVDPRVYYDNLP